MNKIQAFRAAGLLLLCWLSVGCNEYALKKQAAEKRWNKSSAEAQIPSITAQIDRGQIKQAKEALIKCLRTNPDLAQAHYLCGRVHAVEGHQEQAQQSFEKAVELDPEIADAWHNLGSLAVLKMNNARALECYKKAHELAPLNGDYCISLSDVYVETQQTELALQLLNDSLVMQPQNLDLELALAGLHRRLGDNEKAVSIYEHAMLLHGKLPQIVEPCGYLYMTTKQWAKAADTFKELAGMYPEGSERHTHTLRSLAMSSFNDERFAQALSYYDKLSVICREDAEIWLNMAQSALGAEDAEKAAVCAEKALKLRPAWPAAFAALGSAQYLKEDYEGAIRSFNNVIDDDQFGSYGWLMSGKCYQKLGQTAQANAAFERLVKMQGKNGQPTP